MITKISEVNTSIRQISCDCKCKSNDKKCNSDQRWDSDKCQCECKKTIKHHICKKVCLES